MQERRNFASVLRRRADRVQEYFGRARRQYPQVKEALRVLAVALDAEVPKTPLPKKRKATTGAGVATGATKTDPATVSRKWYFQARRFRLERDALQKKLGKVSGAKEGHNMLSEEWLMRVFLSKPNASARSMEQGFGDIVGSDVRTVSRPAMNAIRDAWVEFYKPMVHKAGAALVATTARLAKQGKAAFAPVFLVQIQDEADIRLRSESARDGPAAPSRSRSSKAQQSVLTEHCAGDQAVRARAVSWKRLATSRPRPWRPAMSACYAPSLRASCPRHRRRCRKSGSGMSSLATASAPTRRLARPSGLASGRGHSLLARATSWLSRSASPTRRA